MAGAETAGRENGKHARSQRRYGEQVTCAL